MKKILIAAFILLVLVQWLVPGKMIWDKTTVLHNGKAFRFETEPVDPADPFRGRYIILNYKMDTFRIKDETLYSSEQELYVLLTEDAAGFARIADITLQKPSKEKNYVTATGLLNTYDNFSLMRITYPFTEFYLQEYKAPKAEQAFREAMADSTKKTYALVKVLNGDAVIENVFVNDKPLVQ
jgi:uncharacterized membrane-anchored protein